MARDRGLVIIVVLLLLVLVGPTPPASVSSPGNNPLGAAPPTVASSAPDVWRLVAPVEAGVSRLASGLAARNAIDAAWRRARDAGAYGFSADVTQETVPLALPANAGRSSSARRYYLEGTAAPASRRMELALWLQGGSVLNAEDRLEMRIDGDRAPGRPDGVPRGHHERHGPRAGDAQRRRHPALRL